MPILDCYAKLIEKNPKDAVAWINMGNMYGYKKEFEKAIGCYEKVFEFEPNNASARYNLSVALGKHKIYENFVFVKREK
jgi:tetratricopeptide (TPR) repeat protein